MDFFFMPIGMHSIPPNIALARRQAAVGQHDQAIRSYQDVLPQHLQQLTALLVPLQRRGDRLGLEAAFLLLLQRQPSLSEVRVRLGLLMVEDARLDEAEQLCLMAPQTTPKLMGLRGVVAYARQSLSQAVHLLQQATAIDPCDAWILGHLASALEASGHSDEAHLVALRALQIDPGQPLASAVLSMLEHRHPSPVVRLEEVLFQARGDQERASVLHRLGMMRARRGDVDGSLSAYKQYNSVRYRVAGSPPAVLPDILQAQRAAWEALSAWPARSPIQDNLTDPIFVVGFPHSGISPACKLLGAHPDLYRSGGQPFIPDLLRGLSDPTPDGVAALSSREIAAMRAQYWRAVEQACPAKAHRRLIDTRSMNLIHVGLIHRLFPAAQIIVVLQDPRDSCLGVFMQDDRSTMLDCCHTLLDTARLHASMFSLWETLRRLPGLRWQAIRDEDLVADPASTIRAVLDALSLPWSDAVQDTPRLRIGRRTLSSGEQRVRRPRWHRYAHHLQEVQPLLAPAAAAHGYE